MIKTFKSLDESLGVGFGILSDRLQPRFIRSASCDDHFACNVISHDRAICIPWTLLSHDQHCGDVFQLAQPGEHRLLGELLMILPVRWQFVRLFFVDNPDSGPRVTSCDNWLSECDWRNGCRGGFLSHNQTRLGGYRYRQTGQRYHGMQR